MGVKHDFALCGVFQRVWNQATDTDNYRKASGTSNYGDSNRSNAIEGFLRLRAKRVSSYGGP